MNHGTIIKQEKAKLTKAEKEAIQRLMNAIHELPEGITFSVEDPDDDPGEPNVKILKNITPAWAVCVAELDAPNVRF